MNAARRRKLDELLSTVEQLKADLETLQSEEQDFYDNMPESFQSGEKGDTAQTAIDALEGAVNACDEVAGGIVDAKEA